MKKGTPIIAMKTPAGSSLGIMIVRDKRSARRTKSGPEIIVITIVFLLSPPDNREARCGVTRPTKPSSPENVTALDARRAESGTRTILRKILRLKKRYMNSGHRD